MLKLYIPAVFSLKNLEKYYKSGIHVTFEIYGHFKCLQVSYSKQNDIYWALPHSVDPKAPQELWNTQSKTVPGNFMALVGILNATLYKTEPIFTGLGQGKLS